MTLGPEQLLDLAPAARRAVALEARSVVRLRIGDGVASALIRLPFGVLVGRRIELEQPLADTDTTLRGVDFLQWLDGERDRMPPPVDAMWRWPVPPADGWRRVETVPDTVIRPLVRAGALTLKEAAEREGVPGAQPRAEVADALLDSVVLTVDSDDGAHAEVTLRALSALTRMGFLARGSSAHVDISGRWTRVAAVYGSVFTESGGLGGTLRPL
ncbi:MAG TPA: hypothetical protein VFT67_15825 [Jatrophihabitantaceae bacterium]|nr:hypothetical protein [Jatrophihabitantaceae bacterium]